MRRERGFDKPANASGACLASPSGSHSNTSHQFAHQDVFSFTCSSIVSSNYHLTCDSNQHAQIMHAWSSLVSKQTTLVMSLVAGINVAEAGRLLSSV